MGQSKRMMRKKQKRKSKTLEDLDDIERRLLNHDGYNGDIFLLCAVLTIYTIWTNPQAKLVCVWINLCVCVVALVNASDFRRWVLDGIAAFRRGWIYGDRPAANDTGGELPVLSGVEEFFCVACGSITAVILRFIFWPYCYCTNKKRIQTVTESMGRVRNVLLSHEDTLRERDAKISFIKSRLTDANQEMEKMKRAHEFQLQKVIQENENIKSENGNLQKKMLTLGEKYALVKKKLGKRVMHVECSVCMDAVASHCFGCGHRVCRDCGEKLTHSPKKQCHICRRKITIFHEIF
jgi:hypothetical protein